MNGGPRGLAPRGPFRLGRDAAGGGFLVDDDESLVRVGDHGRAVLEVLGRHGGHVGSDDLIAELSVGGADVPDVAADVVELLRAGVLVRTGSTTIRGTGVGVAAVGSCDTRELRDALLDGGTRTDTDDEPGTVVLVCDDHADPELPAALRRHASRAAVLLVRWGAGRCWIGPFLEPGTGHRDVGTCPECLLEALQRNVDADRPVVTGPTGSDPSVRRAAAAVVATALDGLTGFPGESRTRWGSVVKEVRFRALDVFDHPVAPCVPTATAGELAARTAGHVSTLTGVLAPVEVRPVGARRFLAVSTHPVRQRGSGWRRATAFGGGSSARAAVTACTGEAVERFSTSWHQGVARHTTADQLRRSGSKVTTAADLLHFGSTQRAPEPLPDGVGTDYLELHDVVDGTPLDWWVPAAATTFGHPDTRAAAAARPDSNGCAAGTSVPDAVRRGLLELLERDAVALWWWPRSRRPELPLEVLGSSASREFSRELAARGRTGWFLDLTTDLAVPVAVAVSARTDGTGVVLGFGAAATRPAAARRAGDELLQLLACIEAEGIEQVGSPGWSDQHVDSLEFLLPRGQVRPWPTTEEPDESTVVHRFRRRLAAARIDVGFLDLTHPAVGVPVVRVVAPELRPWHRRLGPGRLRLRGPENPWDPPV